MILLVFVAIDQVIKASRISLYFSTTKDDESFVILFFFWTLPEQTTSYFYASLAYCNTACLFFL